MAKRERIPYKQWHKDAVDDYDYLKSLSNDDDVYDFCGGFCNMEKYLNLLAMPTYKNAYNQVANLIEYFFDNGIGLYEGERAVAKLFAENERVRRICLEYCGEAKHNYYEDYKF